MNRLSTLAVLLFLACIPFANPLANTPSPLVLFSDFGNSERFVASMKGVAVSVDPRLQIFDLTHDIEPQNIWQASFVLNGTLAYWPQGTVFVSVIDPGVGTPRKSVVAKTATGHFIVTPDNGTLTLIADVHGIVEMREIDETTNRRPGSEGLNTFHGRDVYAYTGARLASGTINYAGVGPTLPATPIKLEYQHPQACANGVVMGNLIHAERPFGNIVTNIPASLLAQNNLVPGENVWVEVVIKQADQTVFSDKIPYAKSFGFVPVGEPLLYVDSLNTVGLAVTNGNFAKQFNVSAGNTWSINVKVATAPTSK